MKIERKEILKKLLIITSSPREDAVSTSLARSLAKEMVNHHVKFLDISTLDFPNYDRNLLNKLGGDEGAVVAEDTLSFYDGLLNEFIEADKIVLAFPNWNYMCPPSLVSYILAVSRAGITFKYTDDGSEGLLKNKKALLILSSGGKYENIEGCFAVEWLKTALGMNGITQVSEVIAAGFEEEPSEEKAIYARAENDVKEAAKSFLL